MKSFKKHIFIFLFLLIGSFISVEQVYAGALNWGGVNIECIYEDGGAYSSNTKTTAKTSYCPDSFMNENCLDKDGNITSSCQANDFYLGNNSERMANCVGKKPGASYSYDVISYKTNRMTYNLRGVSNQESATTGNTEFINSPFANNKCMSNLRRGYVPEEDDDGNQTTTTYYKFGSSNSDTSFDEDDYDGVGFWAGLFSSDLTDEEWLDIIEDDDDTFGLVSERYILTDEAGEPDFTLTYKQESEQAAGSDNYAYVMVYSNDVILLKTQMKTTILQTDHFEGVTVNENGEASGLEDNDVIYLNNPEANSYLDSSSVTSYYYAAGQTRYTLSTSETETNNRKFVLFNVGLGSGDAPDTELCDAIMPETSKVLKRVIQIAQLAVPVLLIGLTAFDIGKIVMTGNIDEELPKQKKKIIGRFVIALVFFFLPLVTTLIINMIKETGFVNGDDIKSIECLFEP